MNTLYFRQSSFDPTHPDVLALQGEFLTTDGKAGSSSSSIRLLKDPEDLALGRQNFKHGEFRLPSSGSSRRVRSEQEALEQCCSERSSRLWRAFQVAVHCKPHRRWWSFCSCSILQYTHLHLLLCHTPSTPSSSSIPPKRTAQTQINALALIPQGSLPILPAILSQENSA